MIGAILRRHAVPVLQWSGALVCMVLSAHVLHVHADVLQTVQSTSIPLAREIPQLERRLRILQQQVELSELQHALRTSSPQERVNVFVLPEESDVDRVVLTFDLLRDWLQGQGVLARMSPLTFGETRTLENGARVQDVHFQVALRSEGMELLFAFVRLTGLVTVGDALNADERALLLGQTERENPAGIVAMEQFLATDLLDYARNPRPYEEQVLRSFTSTGFLEFFRTLTRTSLLSWAQRILQGPLGQSFEHGRLWPVQMMSMAAVTVEQGAAPGWFLVDVTLHLHMRGKGS